MQKLMVAAVYVSLDFDCFSVFGDMCVTFSRRAGWPPMVPLDGIHRLVPCRLMVAAIISVGQAW